jgi:hypothetical protein
VTGEEEELAPGRARSGVAEQSRFWGCADTVVSVCVGVSAERAYCAQDFIGLEPIICNFYTNLIRRLKKTRVGRSCYFYTHRPIKTLER